MMGEIEVALANTVTLTSGDTVVSVNTVTGVYSVGLGEQGRHRVWLRSAPPRGPGPGRQPLSLINATGVQHGSDRHGGFHSITLLWATSNPPSRNDFVLGCTFAAYDAGATTNAGSRGDRGLDTRGALVRFTQSWITGAGNNASARSWSSRGPDPCTVPGDRPTQSELRARAGSSAPAGFPPLASYARRGSRRISSVQGWCCCQPKAVELVHLPRKSAGCQWLRQVVHPRIHSGGWDGQHAAGALR